MKWCAFRKLSETFNSEREIAMVVVTKLSVCVHFAGLTESVIAAACSRVGQNVLHLDRFDAQSL